MALAFRALGRGLIGIAILGIGSLTAFCQYEDSSDSGPIHGLIDQFFEADPSHKGFNGVLTYLRLDADLDHGVKLVGSYLQTPGDEWLDEVYVQYEHGHDVFKLGRFRSDFGFSSWSDLYYTPLIGLPMIRAYGTSVAPGLSLYRLDRGAYWESYCGPIQWQLAAVDSSDNDWQIASNHVDTGVARVQLSAGPFLLGLNGLAKASDSIGPSAQIVGLDLTWTSNRAEFRGELDHGLGSNGAIGYYADFFYRPPHLARTQVGLRYQGIRSITSSDSSVYVADNYTSTGGNGNTQYTVTSQFTSGQVVSFAARQFIGPHLTLSVNYGAGSNIPQSAGLLGWSAQVLASFRF